jgi:hypothetical protein
VLLIEGILALLRHFTRAVFALIAAVSIFSSPAQAQVGPCPYGGPSPGYRVVGQTPAGNGVGSILLCEPTGEGQYEQPQQSQERRPYWVDNHAAAVAHPDANDVWIAWNVRREKGGFDRAKKMTMKACKAAMGEGCILMDTARNGAISVMRTHAGYLYGIYGANVEAANSAALSWCATNNYTCTEFKVLSAGPWEEYSNDGSNREELYDPAKEQGGVSRKERRKYGYSKDLDERRKQNTSDCNVHRFENV